MAPRKFEIVGGGGEDGGPQAVLKAIALQKQKQEGYERSLEKFSEVVGPLASSDASMTLEKRGDEVDTWILNAVRTGVRKLEMHNLIQACKEPCAKSAGR